MSDETDRPSDDAAKKATDPNAPPGWERNAEVASPEEDEAIAGLEQAITAAGNNWLKNRFDLVEDEEGALHAQAGSKLESFGKEADEFVRGFFRGFFAKTTEELEADNGLRDPKDVPRGSEVLARLLTKFSDTVTDTWKDYVAEHARTVAGEKRVDGQFAVQHGAGLIREMVENLGREFGGEGKNPLAGGRAFAAEMQETKAQGEPAAEPARAADKPVAAPKIDVRIDYGSILRALFAARKKPEA